MGTAALSTPSIGPPAGARQRHANKPSRNLLKTPPDSQFLSGSPQSRHATEIQRARASPSDIPTGEQSIGEAVPQLAPAGLHLSDTQYVFPLWSTPSSDGARDWRLADQVRQGRGKIVVEIPGTPDFDPSEYVAIEHSQLSRESNNRISQTTIPDSQALADSLPSHISAIEDPHDPFLDEHHDAANRQTAGEDSGEVTDSWEERRATHLATTQLPPPTGSNEIGERIQSHPSGESVSIETRDLVIGEPPIQIPRSSHGAARHNQSSSSSEIPSRQLDPLTQSSAHIVELSEGLGSSPRFLTQVELNLPLLEDLSSDLGEPDLGGIALTPDLRGPKKISSQSLIISETISLPSQVATPSQAAQIVASIGVNRDQIRTQSQTYSELGSEIIPETVQKTVRGTGHLEQASEASSESCGTVNHAPHSNNKPSHRGHAWCVPSHTLLTQGPFFKSPAVGTLRAKMSAPPVEDPQRSAVDDLKELRASFFAETTSQKTSPSPVPDLFISQEPLSAAEQLKRDMGLGISPAHLVSQTRLGLDYQQTPATVAPSDLTTSTDHLALVADQPLLTVSHQLLTGVSDTLESERFPHEDDEDGKKPGQTEFVITLPMAASSRDRYLRIISDSKEAMIEFGQVFASSLSRVPDEVLTTKMDSIFQQLLDICDLPPFADDFHDLSPREMMRHATNSNSKFSFVYEFLNQIRDLSTRILILCRPGVAFRYLEAILSASDFKYTVLGRDSMTDHDGEGLTVVLAKAEEDLTTIHGTIDVVIMFDNFARSVELPANLAYEEDIATLVLSLVVMYSLEHIDLQLGPGPEGLERKNALNLATATAKHSLASPESTYHDPHEVAEIFAKFLRHPEDGLNWEPQVLPDDVFDLWLTQSQNDTGSEAVLQDSSGDLNSRKRPSVGV